MRSKPYTTTGLARVKCVHCGELARSQWRLRPCAIGRAGWYALCVGCDMDLNRQIMEFLRLPDVEARMAAYAATR